jgi:hypothetical protein
MRKIFISYRRDDSGPIAGVIYNWLGQRLHQDYIFFDLHQIHAGKDFRQVIQESLRETGVILVLIGPQWLTLTDSSGQRRLDQPEDWVRLEVEQALLHHQSDQNCCNIIPLLIDNTRMPTASSLPPSIAEMAPLNALPVRSGRDFQRDMERVLKEIMPYISTVESATFGASASSGPQVLLCPTCGHLDRVERYIAVKGNMPPQRHAPAKPVWNKRGEKARGGEARETLWGCTGCLVIPFVCSLIMVIAAISYIAQPNDVVAQANDVKDAKAYLASYFEPALFISGAVLLLMLLVTIFVHVTSLRTSRATYKADFQQKERAHREEMQRWEQEKHLHEQQEPLWNRLYYCHRDRTIFLPGDPKGEEDPLTLINRHVPPK